MTNGNSMQILMILVCLHRCMPGSHCACLSMRTTTLMPRFSLSWIFYDDGNHTWIYRVIALLRRAGLGSSMTNGNSMRTLMILVCLHRCMPGSHCACSSMKMTSLMPVFSWSWIFYDRVVHSSHFRAIFGSFSISFLISFFKNVLQN